MTGRFALALHFAHASQPLDAGLMPGTAIEAELAFFPGAVPFRALVKQRLGAAAPMAEMPGHESATDATAAYAAGLSKNPWLERFPIALRAVVPARRGDAWEVRDPDGCRLPLSPRSEQPWLLAALSGGRPIGLFGEWDGETLTPMGAWAVGRFFPVA